MLMSQTNYSANGMCTQREKKNMARDLGGVAAETVHPVVDFLEEVFAAQWNP